VQEQARLRTERSKKELWFVLRFVTVAPCSLFCHGGIMAEGRGGWIDPNWIQEDLTLEYECGICFQIMERPTSGCSEGHACCRACYEGSLEHQKKCPSCRAPVSHEQLQFNRPLANLIEKLKVRCKNAADEQAGRDIGCLPECL
jgi:hypothetical protein